MKHLFLLLSFATLPLVSWAADFFLQANQPVVVAVPAGEAPVVQTATDLLARDMKTVLGAEMLRNDSRPQILIATYRHLSKQQQKHLQIDASLFQGQAQAFLITVARDGLLAIVGSDEYGTAYGIIELTRMLGVSAWEWWADVTPYRMDNFRLKQGFARFSAPNVSFRGIFINDEDFAFVPWSADHFDPQPATGTKARAIGPKTTEKIFELMLRLRANLYWPPMHECTQPFFLTEGCAELAEQYGIFIGTSHCEPMACNAAGEWKVRGNGSYNFISNRQGVTAFWQQRLAQTADMPMVYTLGMRGVHDGPMEGAKSAEEQKDALAQVIAAQRQLLAENVDSDVATIPQVFIPYKEVQEAYDKGLEVPEDVTLLWSDDNFGYIRHFPTEKERRFRRLRQRHGENRQTEVAFCLYAKPGQIDLGRPVPIGVGVQQCAVQIKNRSTNHLARLLIHLFSVRWETFDGKPTVRRHHSIQAYPLQEIKQLFLHENGRFCPCNPAQSVVC